MFDMCMQDKHQIYYLKKTLLAEQFEAESRNLAIKIPNFEREFCRPANCYLWGGGDGGHECN